MNSEGRNFAKALEGRVAEILATCTRCGKCVEACPMIGAAKVDAGEPRAIAADVLAILETGRGPEGAVAWANACTGSGACIPRCDEGLNPRFMLAMARAALRRAEDGTVPVKEAGAAAFRKLSRGVRMLSGLQLSPAELARLGGSPATEDGRIGADIVFYIGCNVLRMPHISLLCIDVLDALALRYRVIGGPAHCCGVLQFRAGDFDTSGRIAFNTIRHIDPDRASEVVCWCPSCGKQFCDVILPAYERAAGRRPFAVTMFAAFLQRHTDELRPLLVNPINKRVALHEHPGLAGTSEAVRSLLQAIPGLEFVDLGQPRLGSMCSDFSAVPGVKRDAHARLLAAAKSAGVTTLAGVYHACHRELCAHERDWPFEVVNFMELIGQSMGVTHPDTFKRIRLAQDVDAIIQELRDQLEGHGLDPAEVREEVLEYILGA